VGQIRCVERRGNAGTPPREKTRPIPPALRKREKALRAPVIRISSGFFDADKAGFVETKLIVAR
jgi:hypothetical protein